MFGALNVRGAFGVFSSLVHRKKPLQNCGRKFELLYILLSPASIIHMMFIDELVRKLPSDNARTYAKQYNNCVPMRWKLQMQQSEEIRASGWTKAIEQMLRWLCGAKFQVNFISFVVIWFLIAFDSIRRWSIKFTHSSLKLQNNSLFLCVRASSKDNYYYLAFL